MDISIFLAQAFGIFFVVSGAAMFLHPHIMKNIVDNLTTNRSVIFASGFFALILGIPLIIAHNIWEGTWQIIVTIIAWATFLKGVTLLLAPDLAISWAGLVTNKQSTLKIAYVLMVLLGLYLMYVGFDFGAG